MKNWIQMPNQRMTGFSGGSYVKETACNVGDVGLIPGLGRSPGEENGNLLQYSYLLLLLSHFSRVRLCVTPSLGFSRQEHWSGLPFSSPMHKWKVKVKLPTHVWLFATPWTAAYQAPPSMGFSRREYWSWVPFLPGEFQFLGQRSQAGYTPQGCKESDMTEWSAFSLSKTIVFTVNFA